MYTQIAVAKTPFTNCSEKYRYKLPLQIAVTKRCSYTPRRPILYLRITVTHRRYKLPLQFAVEGSIRTIVAEEGAGMLAKGWLPTLLGYSAQVGQSAVFVVVVVA